MFTKVMYVGNTKITVHSPNGIFNMTQEEQTEWFREQWKQGNPYVRRTVEIALEIQARNGGE